MNTINPLSLFGSWFASPAEITVFTIMALSMAGVIIYSYFFYTKKQVNDHKKLMRNKYESYLMKLSLTDVEKQIINKMTDFLENEDLKYHMITNIRTFDDCAEKLYKIEKVPEVLLESLKRKLSFPSKKGNNNYFTSEDLPIGMPALILIDKNNKQSAVISENTHSIVTLHLKNEIGALREGMPLSVYFHDNQKIFTINTTVQKHIGKFLSVSHSLLESQKRRSFKRKAVKLPLLIKHSDFEEIPHHSYIIDLSEGGASLENPDFSFKKNERITLYYHIDTDDGFHIRGEVIRLSAKGRVIHVKFFDKDLTIRSRIKTILK
jgi:hypothetical protein